MVGSRARPERRWVGLLGRDGRRRGGRCELEKEEQGFGREEGGLEVEDGRAWEGALVYRYAARRWWFELNEASKVGREGGRLKTRSRRKRALLTVPKLSEVLPT